MEKFWTHQEWVLEITLGSIFTGGEWELQSAALMSHVCALCTHADPNSKVHTQISGQMGANCSHLLLLYRALLPSSRNPSLKWINITQHDWRTIDPLGLKHFLLLSLVKIEIKIFMYVWCSSQTAITRNKHLFHYENVHAKFCNR